MALANMLAFCSRRRPAARIRRPYNNHGNKAHHPMRYAADLVTGRSLIISSYQCTGAGCRRQRKAPAGFRTTPGPSVALWASLGRGAPSNQGEFRRFGSAATWMGAGSCQWMITRSARLIALAWISGRFMELKCIPASIQRARRHARDFRQLPNVSAATPQEQTMKGPKEFPETARSKTCERLQAASQRLSGNSARADYEGAKRVPRNS
jgi:hypothetical protein